MKKTLFLLPILIFFIPKCCFACTPLMIGLFFIGPTYFGSFALSSALGLLLAVGIKIVVFLIVSDYKSVNIVWMMLLANVVSTLFGMGVALPAAVPFLILLFMPISYVLFLLVAKNLHRRNIFLKQKPSRIALLLTGLLFITMFIYGAAQGTLDMAGSLVTYWVFKILSAILAMGITLFFSVIIEEAVIAYFFKNIHKVDKNFMKPVLWANVIAFLIVIGLAALKSLPVRLKSPGFLNPNW